MTKTQHNRFVSELKNLVEKTGLSQAEVARRIDATPETLSRWLSGDQMPAHPAMLRRALQLLALEQGGVITKKLIESL